MALSLLALETEKMRILLLLLLGLPALCRGQANMITNQVACETQSLSITNKYGDVFTNLTVSRVTGDGLLLSHKAGTTKVKFADLPPELREKYEPLAAEATRKEIEGSRATKDFMALTQRLQREDAAVKAKVERQWKEENARRFDAASMAGQEWVVKGTVMQKTSDGLLISSIGGHTGTTRTIQTSIHYGTSKTIREGGCAIYEGRCLLVGYLAEGGVVDGNEVCAQAIYDGQYTYDNVLGARQTVRRFKSLQ